MQGKKIFQNVSFGVLAINNLQKEKMKDRDRQIGAPSYWIARNTVVKSVTLVKGRERPWIWYRVCYFFLFLFSSFFPLTLREVVDLIQIRNRKNIWSYENFCRMGKDAASALGRVRAHTSWPLCRHLSPELSQQCRHQFRSTIHLPASVPVFPSLCLLCLVRTRPSSYRAKGMGSRQSPAPRTHCHPWSCCKTSPESPVNIRTTATTFCQLRSGSN